MNKYEIEAESVEEPTPPLNIEIDVDNIEIITNYNPDYCSAIIKHCANGFSPESFAASEYIDPDIMKDWMDDYPKFKAAVKISMSMELLWWEKMNKKVQQNPDIYQFMLPTINRKLAVLENLLCKTGLRKNLFNYQEPTAQDKEKKEEEDIIKAMEEME